MKTTKRKPPIKEELLDKIAMLVGKVVQYQSLQKAAEKLTDNTPLHLLMLAIERGDSESFEAVLPFCLDNINDNIVPLMTSFYDPAATTLLGYAVSKKKTEFCRRLIACGAKIKNSGKLLRCAIANHDQSTLRLLVKFGADVNATVVNGDTNRKETLLHFAARCNQTKAMRILLRSGAKLRVKNGRGYNALHTAVENGSLTAVRMLVKAGIHINSRTTNGKTPLALAVNTAANPGLFFTGTDAYLARVVNFLKRHGGHE